jgi:Holliday junction resolvase
MMTPYRRGVAFERRVQHLLERHGWRVIRSAGSHTPVDLVAWPPVETLAWLAGQVWVIQCKRGARLSGRAQADLCDWADFVHGEAVWARPGLAGRGVVFRVWRDNRWTPVDVAAVSRVEEAP